MRPYRNARPYIALSPTMGDRETPIIRALLSSTDHGILMTDHAGNDILCNARFGELFDIDPAIVVSSRREDVRRMAMARVRDPEEFNALLERIYANPTLEHEDEIELHTEPPRILRRYTGPVLNAAGENIGRVWTFQDITQEKRLQAQVENYAARLQEKLQIQASELRAAQEKMMEAAQINAVGTLAASIAHEIRNILTPLRLELSMVGGTEAAKAARAHVDRLLALTHALLALWNPATIHPGPIHLKELLTAILPLVRPQADVDGVTITTRISRRLPLIYGDRGRLEQMFIILFLNALRAMAAHGGRLTIRAAQEGAFIRVDVVDTGRGIPPEHLPHLFDPFFTTRPDGFGLGLYSARRIADEHHGDITAQSRPGRGSRFSVRLPMYESSLKR